MASSHSYPAYLEILGDDGQPFFAATEDVLASVKMQSRLVDRGAFRKVIAGLRKRGHLYEVPYIGPKP